MIHGRCPNCKTPAALSPGQKKLTCESCGKSYGVRWKTPQQPELLQARRPCGQCSAPMLIPAVGKTVTCNQCHTPHRIHRDRAAGKLRLVPLGSLKSPLDDIKGYAGWTAADRSAGCLLNVLWVAAIALFMVSVGLEVLPWPSMLVVIVILLVFVIRRGVIKYRISRRKVEMLHEAAAHLKLSPSFVKVMEQHKVDVLSPRGRRILDLYQTAGEKAAGAVAAEQVYLSMTEGMVRLAWGDPSVIMGKAKGADRWQYYLSATQVSKNILRHQRMLWVYKSGNIRKAWFKKGRVFRARHGLEYATESIDT